MHFKKNIKFIIFIILYPLIFIVEKINKYFSIKFTEIDATRIGHFIMITEGYFIAKKNFNELKNNKLIFYFRYPISNHQIEKMVRRLIPINIFSPLISFYEKLSTISKNNSSILYLANYSTMRLCYKKKFQP